MTSNPSAYAIGPDGIEYTEADCERAANCDCGYRDGCADCHEVLVAMGWLSEPDHPADIAGLMADLAVEFGQAA